VKLLNSLLDPPPGHYLDPVFVYRWRAKLAVQATLVQRQVLLSERNAR